VTHLIFELGTPVYAILLADNCAHAPITIPAGAKVTLVSGQTKGCRMVDVEWDGKILTLFAIDLLNRGTRVHVDVPEPTGEAATNKT
jgi:hypothetical protein